MHPNPGSLILARPANHAPPPPRPVKTPGMGQEGVGQLYPQMWLQRPGSPSHQSPRGPSEMGQRPSEQQRQVAHHVIPLQGSSQGRHLDQDSGRAVTGFHPARPASPSRHSWALTSTSSPLRKDHISLQAAMPSTPLLAPGSSFEKSINTPTASSHRHTCSTNPTPAKY